jgi:hypothetical protein
MEAFDALADSFTKKAEIALKRSLEGPTSDGGRAQLRGKIYADFARRLRAAQIPQDKAEPRFRND